MRDKAPCLAALRLGGNRELGIGADMTDWDGLWACNRTFMVGICLFIYLCVCFHLHACVCMTCVCLVLPLCGTCVVSYHLALLAAVVGEAEVRQAVVAAAFHRSVQTFVGCRREQERMKACTGQTTNMNLILQSETFYAPKTTNSNSTILPVHCSAGLCYDEKKEMNVAMYFLGTEYEHGPLPNGINETRQTSSKIEMSCVLKLHR